MNVNSEFFSYPYTENNMTHAGGAWDKKRNWAGSLTVPTMVNHVKDSNSV